MFLYTAEEFVHECIDRGYAYRKDKKKIQAWCEDHPKNEYDEDDFIKVYRYLQRAVQDYGHEVNEDKWTIGYGGHKHTKHYNDDEWN